MSIILLLILFFLYLNFRTTPQDWRLAVVSAAVAFGVMIVMLTEVLSLARLLTRPALLTSWSIVLSALVVIWWARGGRPAWPTLRVTPIGLGIAAILAVIGVIAWIAPPNSTDAMTYHMARVWMWAYHASVAHYPVFDTRHLYNPPFMEFVQLHIFLLDNGDNATNLVQWFALIIGVFAASYVVKLMGGGRNGEMLAAAFIVSIPIAVQQASGAKNDLLVAVWVLCVLVYALLLYNQHSRAGSLWIVLGLAASTALATFTKPTGYLFALPILLWLGLACLFSRRWRIILIAGVVGLGILAINAGHFTRNYRSFGNPVSDASDSSDITVDQITLRGTISVGVRSFLLNTPLPPPVSPFVYRNLERLHDWIGLDINEDMTTFEDRRFRFIEWQDAFIESRTPNPFHLVLIIATVAVLLLRPSRITHELMLVVVGQAVLLSALIAWQPWGTRLQLGIFMTGGVLMGVVFGRELPPWVAKTIGLVALISALPWLIMGRPRSFLTVERTKTVAMTSVSRDEAYFLAASDSLYGPHSRLIDNIATVEGCRDVGLYLEDRWQYPLLRGLAQVIPDLRVQHLDAVEPLSALYNRPPYANFEPCLVVDATESDTLHFAVGDQTFYRMWREDPYTVYRPSGFVATPYANEFHTVQAFPQPDQRAFHIYSDCVEVTCRLVTIIELDALEPESEPVTFAADDGWRADVTYLDEMSDGLHRYRVAVFDAASELQDNGMILLLGDDIVTWE